MDLFREIKKKKLILENRKPFTREVANYIDELNLVDWVYTALKLDGSGISKPSVQKIIKGDFVVDVTVRDHSSIVNYLEAIKLANDMSYMSIELNEKYLFRFYQSLSKPEKLEYRRTNPVLLALNYNPPHPKEIEEQMDIFFHFLNTDDCNHNPILKAAYLHNKLIEIYPFETDSEGVARMALYYELIYHGYPPIPLNISEQEYYAALREYLKNENIQPIYEALERAVYNKLDIMLQLTAD